MTPIAKQTRNPWSLVDQLSELESETYKSNKSVDSAELLETSV